MRRLVKVIRKDIERGFAGEAKRCPVALALQRTFPELDDLSVPGEDCKFYKSSSESPTSPYYKKLPKKVWKFIEHFDVSGTGKPFSFTISL